MSDLSRRKFLKGSLAAAGGAFVLSDTKASARPLGANERIRLGVAGIKGRGGSHIGAFAGMKNVEVTYLIDPDSRLFDSRSKAVEEKGDNRPKCVQDVRQALEDPSLDAISIATPNHWHSLMTIWACQAGKDVYVEKPMSHNIHEGRVAVQAARKYGRIVQHGTQSRSSEGYRKVIAAIHSGKLGKLKVARGLCYKPSGGYNTRGSIGYKPHTTPPSELAWNLWVGPRAMQPYHDNLVHYRWHWFYEFGNGDLGNQGVHEMDKARWSIKGGTLPKSVITFGGRLGYQDQADAASTEVSIMDFGETQLIFETRGLPSGKYRGVGVGNIFELEAGVICNQEFFPNDSDKKAPLPEVEYEMGPGGGCWGNFIAAMRSRKTSDLNANVLEAHYSSALCHLANASYRVGTKVPYVPRTDVFDDNPEALDAMVRTEKYLIDNEVEVGESTGWTLGRKLVVDADSEKIVGDAEANDILHGYYRKGFEVPEKIA